MTKAERQSIDKCTLAARLFVACETIEEFDERFQSAGYTYTGAECACLHGGDKGHHPACGWELKSAVR